MQASPFRPLTLRHPSPFPYIVFAGPCSAETEAQTLATAEALRARGIRLFRASLWKPRTRPGSFEGVGSEGLPWLQRVERELGMQVATEVASASHVEEALAAGLDTFWIGARTTTSPFAMAELAEALSGERVTVLVKNPLNPDIELWEGALLRLYQAGIPQIGLYTAASAPTPRGSIAMPPSGKSPLSYAVAIPSLPSSLTPATSLGAATSYRWSAVWGWR